MLTSLNTKPVGNIGLIAGGLSIVGAATYFFKVLSDPDEIVWLYEAVKTHADPNHSIARLAGAGVAVVGAFTVSLLAAYLGKPSTIE